MAVRRKHALREVARVAMAECVGGFHFGRYEDDVRMLQRLHHRVQTLKAEGLSQEGDAMRRARYERAQQASYVAELIVDADGEMVLPSTVKIAVARYRAIDRPQPEETREPVSTSQGVVALSSNSFEEVDAADESEDMPTVAYDEAATRIHGLESIPACGAPLPVFAVSKLPETLQERIENRFDNADYWYSEHRRAAIGIAGIVAVALLAANFTAAIYIGTHERDYLSAPHIGVTAGGVELTQGQGAGQVLESTESPPRDEAGNRSYLLFQISILVALAGLLGFVAYRSRLKKIDFMGQYSLRMVKAIMVPVNVSVKRRFTPLQRARFYDDPENLIPVRSLTSFERRVRAAQVAALVLLTVALFVPQVIRMVQAANLSVQSTEVNTTNGSSTELHASYATESEPVDEGIRDQLRSQYARLTALIILTLLMLFVAYLLRRFHRASRNYIQGFDPSRHHQYTSGRLPAEPKPWARAESEQEPPIDHEDPYSAKVRKIADQAKELSFAKQFKIEAMIAWYRIFNKWRVLSIFVLLVDNTLRFMGVIVFGAMLVLSVVMPLMVLVMFQDGNGPQAVALRSFAEEMFPEMYPDKPSEEESITGEEKIAGSAEELTAQGRLNLEVPEPVEIQPKDRWVLPYVLVLTGIAGINLLLMGLRLLARRRTELRVAGTNLRLTTEAAISSLVVIAALWLWDRNPGYAMVQEVSEQVHALPYRTPLDPSRVQVLTEGKFFAQYFLPESTFSDVWYVDRSSPGPLCDGQSWNTAYHTIEEGVLAAAFAGGGEVWVAKGYYRPKPFSISGSEGLVAGLGVPNNVHVFGGFGGSNPGGHEESRLERNWDANVTVLDFRPDDSMEARSTWIYGFGNWTLDGLVVVGGRIVADSAARSWDGSPHVNGVIGNVQLVYPGVPTACAIAGADDQLIFHHTILVGSEGVVPMKFEARMTYPGIWDPEIRQPAIGPPRQLALFSR